MRAPSLLLALAFVGCGGTSPPQRDCFARVWLPASDPSTVAGSWDGWQGRIVPEPYDAEWRLARFDLPPGEHAYLLDRGDVLEVDPSNPLTTYDSLEREVSLLEVRDCSQPSLKLERAAWEGGQVVVEGLFLANQDQAGLDAIDGLVAGVPMQVEQADADSGRFRLVGTSPSPKASILVTASDDEGNAVEPAHVTAWETPLDPRDLVIYQVVTDRFRGDGGSILAPPETPGSRAGGTLDGVRSGLDDGYFERFGANAVWLSPAYVNPEPAREGVSDGRLYEGYHGYWPLDSTAVDPRIGGDAALDALVAGAHQRGLRLLLDVVPNHVYEGHPRYQEHASDGWFNPAGCVCGTPECPWSENIQQCWFTPYLPDVRWQNPAAGAAARADVRYWVRRFDLDGVRVDAVPMMPRSANRRIAHDLRRMSFPPEETFLLGEVFVGPGQLPFLTYQLGPAGLDSVFDFPLMWELHAAVARDPQGQGGGFASVEAALLAEEATLTGTGSHLARILDNHDTVRLISVAQGDAGGDPWDEPAVQPTERDPYARLALAHAIVMTLPGPVVIYQGDEVGLAGGGDPDNRRVLPSDDALSDDQRWVRERFERLGQLRRCSDVLRRGTREALLIEQRRYAYSRRLDDREIVIALSTAGVDTEVVLPLQGTWLDVVTGELVDGTAPMIVPGRGARILLDPEDPCAQPW